ncbi:glycosyltransferase family 4 protein [Pontibacter ramchanderi]|uniref:Glycosyl transferase family 1 n=1 Tax=Pontibacter ramchanderi TaxID=1179743 RepID=A0A2N3V1M6_9BACT|nr:glycosyltransferase family 4 protein [Pontibacter ramchanderi]PKV75527.1 glycosyl transferase family 1 [Pontibacter ramchanderi]
MKIVYTAPNRGHHYLYAGALNTAGNLHAFISGFPRISPRAKAPDLMGKLFSADILQTLYVLSLKMKLPDRICTFLAFLSKIEQDLACRKFVKNCDVFLYYSGSGLFSSRYGKKRSVINIVEAVNSHVEYQEELLENEFLKLKLPWKPFLSIEKKRRLQEYKEADYILLPSEFVKRSFIEKGFPAEKLIKIPYGFNKLDNSRSKRDARSESFTVLYVGTISVRKGVRYLIEAFKQLNCPQKQLIIVGPDANDGAINGLDLTPNIVFTGVLKGEKLKDAYRSADVFCLPSIEEGLALVLGEALSYGLPVIATCNTGAEDVIVDGNEGYIVPIRDSEVIREKLQMLIDNRELLNNLRTNTIARLENLNGWEEAGKELISNLYQVFCRNNR